MPPYTSYFSDAQSAINQWNLGIHDAGKICAIWKDVRTELNGTYSNAEKHEQENFLTKKLDVYDDSSTRNSYDCGDVEISQAEFKDLVDIQRALVMLRGFCTSGQKDKAREKYKTIWVGIKKRVGAPEAAERIASEFNKTYCPDEFMHYVHYLAKSRKPPSARMKPWVFEHKGKTYLRVWHKKT
jgi:hypothetical protein